MTTTRRAVIDVGTNSVKLLVADVDRSSVEPVHEESEQTRLGEGFYETHRLQASAVARTARAVAAYVARARELKAVSTRIIATSAARDAINPDELVSAVRELCDTRVEIISGEEEASLVFRGVASTPGLAAGTLLILDVGGGSTEFILGRRDAPTFCRSFPIGALRLMQTVPHSDPPTLAELNSCRGWIANFLKAEVVPTLAPALSAANLGAQKAEPVRLVGTGGTALILAHMEAHLAAFDRDRTEGMVLSSAQVRSWVERLWSQPLRERRQIIGLPEKRADIILTGVAIYEGVLETLGFTELQVSTRGLRFAVVQE